MHDQVVRGNVEPLQRPDGPEDERVALEKLLVFEPDHVVVVDVVPEVLVTHVFVSAVGRAAQPAHRAAEGRIVSAAAKHEIVPALMDQVGGDDHRVCQQHRGQGVHGPGFVEQAGEARDITCDGVDDRAATHEQAS